jgi:hypothetical protein
MEEENGLSTLLDELYELSKEMPEEMPPRLVTAGMIALLKESRATKAETGRRLRRVEKGLIVTIAGLAILAVSFIATHADVPWLSRLIAAILGI